MQNLKDKVAVVFAASGDIAGAVARSFSQHGAKVYVTARNLEAVKALAQEIKNNGGWAEAARVDATNEAEIDDFLKKVVADNGQLDVVFNGIGVEYSEMGGRPPTTIATFKQFMAPMEKICGSQFLTSRVAAKYMMQTQSEGTILLLTAALSRSKLPNLAGITAASAAVEGMTRSMAAEWGADGIKVICICAGAIMETKRISGWIEGAAKEYHLPVEQLITQYKAFDILKTNPTLKQLGETAAFLASETGVAFNSHIVDVDCGKLNIL
ncbi:SDR family NAD(P)-dependent oxidoreductase [Mucilaginibacter sp. X4EP1]|uniref:SDR family NAD(P)-dependent oxidoreductase n=1 Tax=Mucilaginibacter sp. X4EP1 TaxID=2723092 RepID=UPI0021688181|nr:SDR family oxidoreductase [Mucilaginibacter sp. X4EP1]MCS3813533.1 NAD(P)-dependent dehydrogenase (short-subunit alcohol dehydrogenase family) [Mucilaginibacter sp. X4EP1]